MTRVERWAPLSGVAAVVLWVVAVVMLDTNEASVLGDGDAASAARIAAYLKSETATIYLGTTLFAIGSIAFVWFLGLLRERLAAAGDGTAPWAFASGVLLIAMLFGFFALRLAAASALDMRSTGSSDSAVEALFVGMDGFFVMAWFPLGGFYLATGLAALQTRALPRWLGWTTIALGILSLIVWIGWVAEFLLVPWVLLVSALLVRDRRRACLSPKAQA
jgi:hypothetical protein